jgi:hypothetical protein
MPQEPIQIRGQALKKGSAEAISPGTSIELISDSMLKLSYDY